MAAQVVYRNVTPAAGTNPGGIFGEKLFWLSRGTPQRLSYVDKIKSNGGNVTDRENEADFKVADHLRPKTAPPGSVSYEYIDACLSEGEILPIQSYVIHPSGEPRIVGSGTQAAKATRAHFTAEDDRILMTWVSNNETHLAGNIIYQNLEAQYPHHSWQSWRDRYVKGRAKWVLNSLPTEQQQTTGDEGTVGETTQAAEHSTPTPEQPHLQQGRDSGQSHPDLSLNTNCDEVREPVPSQHLETSTVEEGGPREEREYQDPGSTMENREFTSDEFEKLLRGGKLILSIPPDQADKAWETYATRDPSHTSSEWRSFWETRVRPVYLELKSQRETSGAPSDDSESSESSDSGSSSSNDEIPDDSDETGNENNSEKQYSEAVLGDLDAGSAFTTPPPREGHGKPFEILADDGQKHLSTPLRSKSSPSQKRVRQDISEILNSPSSERSPLKRRRMDFQTEEDENTRDPHLLETFDQSTVATSAYETAPTGETIEHASNVIDLRGDSDGHSSGSDEESAHRSTDSETARPIPLEPQLEPAFQEDEAPDAIDTQGYIDAQLMSEISSAAQRAESETLREVMVESIRQGQSMTATASDGFQCYPELGEESEGSSDDVEGLVESRSSQAAVTRSPQKAFAPAAFRSSPGSEPTERTSIQQSLPSAAPTPKKMPPISKSTPQHSVPVPTGERPDSPMSPSSVEEEISSDDLVAKWREAHAQEGTDPEFVKTAYRAASGDLPLAERVLDALTAGEPIPEDVRGIWTSEEDLLMKQGTEMDFGRLVKKHGRKLFDERIEFLQLFDDEEDESEGSFVEDSEAEDED